MADVPADKPTHLLAQVNIAMMKAPLTDPLMAGFVARLEEINALAESSRGFVWRLQADEENESQIVAFERDGVVFNLTLWRSVETLREFVYNSQHKELIAAREQWFKKMEGPSMALWWVPRDHLPTIDEALLRLDRLELLGPSQNSFTFGRPFEPPVRHRREPEQDTDTDNEEQS